MGRVVLRSSPHHTVQTYTDTDRRLQAAAAAKILESFLNLEGDTQTATTSIGSHSLRGREVCRAARRAASEEGIKESSPETSGDGMVGFIPLAGAATTSRRARGPQTARRCLPTSGRGIQTATPEELCVQCRGVRRSFAPVAVPRPAPSSCRPAAGVDTFRPPMTSPRRCLFIRPHAVMLPPPPPVYLLLSRFVVSRWFALFPHWVFSSL